MAAIMLLSVFFVSGALASCPEHAQPLVTTPQEMEALSGACLQIPCNFSINAEETFDSDLKEAESVTVTCSAPAPCPHSPPKLTWTLQQNPPNTMEENPDRTFTTKIQKTLTLTDQHDGFNITCSASYPVNEGRRCEDSRGDNDSPYAPKDVTVVVSPADPVSVGSVVNLTCSCRGIRAADGFAWLMMMSDGRLHMMEDNTQLYVFEVTNSDQQIGTVDGHLILKMLGIIMLLSTLVIFEWPLYITTPKQMEALSGSCLLIPCNFSAVPDVGFNSSREIFGVWIKNEPAFAQKPNNFEKSHTDKYFFRIENSPFLATAACDPLQITVK
ncbi:Vascular cell adhesion protein 1, partial [Dissostichus eleginoides]